MVSRSVGRLLRQRSVRSVPSEVALPATPLMSLSDVLAGQGDIAECAEVLSAHEAELTTDDLLTGVKRLRDDATKVNLFAAKCAESAEFFSPGVLVDFCRIFSMSESDEADGLYESALERLKLRELTVEHAASVLKSLKVAKKGESDDWAWAEEIPQASAKAVTQLLEALPRSAPEEVTDALFERFAACLQDAERPPMRIVVRALSAAVVHNADDVFITRVTEYILEHRDKLEAVDVAFSLRAARKLESQLPEEFYSAILMEVPRLAATLNRLDVFMILRSLGKAKVDPSFLAWLAAEIRRDVTYLSVPEISVAVRVFSERNYNKPNFYLQLMQSYLNSIERCSPSDAVACLYSFAKMQRAPLDKVFSASQRKLSRECLALSPRDIALSLWAFARHRRRELELFAKDVEPELIRHVNRSGGYSPQDVAIILWSLSLGENRRGSEGMSALLSYLTENIRSFPPKSLVVVCVALDRMHFKTQITLAHVYRAVYSHLSSMTTNQVCVTFLLMANSGLRDLDITLRFLYEVRRRTLNPKNLNSCCLALAQLEDSGAEPEVWREIKGVLKERAIETLRSHPSDAKSTLGIFETAKTLGFTEEEIIKLMGRLECLVPEYSGVELTRLLTSLAIVQEGKNDFTHIPLCRAIFNALQRKAEPFNHEQLLTCFHAISALGYSRPKIRKKLGTLFKIQVLRKVVPKSVIVHNIHVLEDLGVWQRLPMGTQNNVWGRLPDDLQEAIPKPVLDKREEAPIKHKDELYVVPTRKRYRRRVLSEKGGLERLPPKTLFEPMESDKYLEEKPDDSSAFKEFVDLVKQK